MISKIPVLRRPHPHRRVYLEPLEDRTLLDSGGVSAFLTMSFVPDGTRISGRSSELFSSFDKLADTRQWQQAVEQAFNQWAIHTNADIGIVSDSGDPLGTPGRREGDTRFGDVRIAAAPLDENVLAITFPTNNVALGTWSGDVIFNSVADWTSIDQISAVALHEAGHVFGLAHSTDPASAMHTHGASDVTSLSPADIAAIQFLYGSRAADANETESSNDELNAATQLSENLAGELLSLSYGDIAPNGDVDVFHIATEDEIEGEISIRVQSDGLSLLSPLVKLYGEDEELLETAVARQGLAILTHELDDQEEFFISVEAGPAGRSPVGRYSIAVALSEDDFDDDDFEEFEDGGTFFIRTEGDLRVRSQQRRSVSV